LIKLLKINFPKLKINFKPWDRLTPKRGGLSIEKAKKLLNYKPSFEIESGYKKYINWYKEFHSK